MKGPMILIALVALVAIVNCAPATEGSLENNVIRNNQKNSPGTSFDITDGDNSYVVDNILPYDPLDPKLLRGETSVVREQTNKIKPSSYLETPIDKKNGQGNNNDGQLAYIKMLTAGGAANSGSPNTEKIKDIAMNSREVRLVGPNQKEVEMKDDLPTKVVVALENLQKEAKEVLVQVNDKLDQGWTEIKRSEVWGQVNEKLDKGWTDLKSMVESVVSTSSKSG